MILEALIIKALKLIGLPKEITCILSDRDGVEPPAPYLIINVIDTINIGLPRKTSLHKDGDVTETLYQVKDNQVSFTLHAASTDPVHDWFRNFHTGLFSDLVDWAFTQQGLGLVDSRDIMYQPQPVDGKAYKRAILDITFRSELSSKFKVHDINNIGVTGKPPVGDGSFGDIFEVEVKMFDKP